MTHSRSRYIAAGREDGIRVAVIGEQSMLMGGDLFRFQGHFLATARGGERKLAALMHNRSTAQVRQGKIRSSIATKFCAQNLE